jgi:DNA-binding transcriptional regulator LsrR (DeoR family)
VGTSEATEHTRTRIARLHYVEGMTQDEIVSLTGLNRSRAHAAIGPF